MCHATWRLPCMWVTGMYVRVMWAAPPCAPILRHGHPVPSPHLDDSDAYSRAVADRGDRPKTGRTAWLRRGEGGEAG